MTLSLPPLVSANWLAPLLKAPGMVVLDASWYLPTSGRDPELEYRAGHIPHAIRFDLDAISDPATDLPHMLPSPERFAHAMEHLGIQASDRIICYDGSGVNLSAARAWWMFRVFGHHEVAVLDGGFPNWASVTRPVQRGVVHRTRSGYPASGVDRALVADRAAIERIAAGLDLAQLADCRPAARWLGEADEPRPGLRRGHVAGSRSTPFTELTDPDTGLMLKPDALRAWFADRGLDPARPIVAMCGSGTSACALALAVEVLRADEPDRVGPPVAIYDASWAEWGQGAVS